jgi:hypothetical protein
MLRPDSFSAGLLTIVLGMFVISPLAAQPKPAGAGHPAVDIVTLKSGRSLRGVVAFQEPNGSLSIVVSREWLSGANPTLLETALKENQEGRRTGWTQTRDRITERQKSPIDSPNLAFFLKQEHERLVQLLADRNPPDLDLLWLDVRHETIAKVVRATLDRQKIALLGWNEHLPHVETRDASSLEKELTNRGVKLDASVDLSDRVPARSQTDDEWAARMAIVEYSLAEPLDFQGMGDVLARTREGEPPNLGHVLPKILQQQIGSLFKDLINDGRLQQKPKEPKGDVEWLVGAIRQAEREKMRGFRVTRLDIDSTATRVTVETRFVAKLAEGRWRTVWQCTETGDGTKPRPQAEARIEQDPQLKTAVDTLKSIGFADGDALKQAIRIGAATMATQQEADSKFALFRDSYVRHLDGPPLVITAKSD